MNEQERIRHRSDQLLAEHGPCRELEVFMTDEMWGRLDQFAEEMGVTPDLALSEIAGQWLDAQNRKSKRRKR
jgi:hypothetical protein